MKLCQRLEKLVNTPGVRQSGRMTNLILVVLILLTVSLSANSETSSGPVVGVLTASQSSYRTAVVGLKSVLDKAGIRTVVIELPKGESKEETTKAIDALREAKAKIVVAVGTPATKAAVSSVNDLPIIFCLVPNVLDQAFWGPAGAQGRRLAGVATDISPREQIEWVLTLFPSLKNLGLLYSEHTERTFQALQALAREGQIGLTGVRASKTNFMDAVKELGDRDCEAVLMLPDAAIYNSTNVRALLVWAIRQKKPVFTFSDNLVKAGALAGQYAEPERLGEQTGELVKEVLKGLDVKKAGLRYPTNVSTAVNERTAELIGLSIEEAVLERVTKRYGKE